MSESGAIAELRERLSDLDAEGASLAEEHEALGRRVERNREEREAIRVAIRSLGGEAEAWGDARGERSERRARPRPARRDGPTIRVLAMQCAQEHGGRVVIRDLLRRTRAHGFKSDHGGLHTYLKGLEEFVRSAPGEFEICVNLDEDDGDAD